MQCQLCLLASRSAVHALHQIQLLQVTCVCQKIESVSRSLDEQGCRTGSDTALELAAVEMSLALRGVDSFSELVCSAKPSKQLRLRPACPNLGQKHHVHVPMKLSQSTLIDVPMSRSATSLSSSQSIQKNCTPPMTIRGSGRHVWRPHDLLLVSHTTRPPKGIYLRRPADGGMSAACQKLYSTASRMNA